MNIEPSQAPEQLSPEESGNPSIDDIEAVLGKMDGTDEEIGEELEQEVEEAETEETVEEEQPKATDWKSQEFEVNGETVSGAELASGYMKDADYRQKTAQTAQLRREVEQKFEYIEKELSSRANRLDVLANALYQEIAGDQSQLQSLVESDPAEYLRRSHYLAQRNNLLQQALQEREATNQLQEQTRQRQIAEYAQAEQIRLTEVLPEWRDKKVAEAEGRELAEYLLGKGYETAELSELYDHRALVLARKAMLYDKRANLKPVSAKASVAVSPGASQTQSQGTRTREQLRQKAIKTGSRDDLVNALAQYIN